MNCFNKILLLTTFLIISSGVYAAQESQGLAPSGTLSCQKQGEEPDPKISCELSSALFLNKKIFSTNDKLGGTLYVYDAEKFNQINGFAEKLPVEARIQLPDALKVDKIESLTKFGDWILVVGSYIRDDQPSYSRIIALKYDEANGTVSQAHEVAKTDIRSNIQQFVKDSEGKPATYFKIEASAVVPSKNDPKQQQLLLGIREAGRGYKDGEFEYKVFIVGVDIHEENGQLNLGKNWELIADMSDQYPGRGISDLSYAPKQDRILMSTSFENAGNLAGEIFQINRRDFFNGSPFQETGKIPGHKPEGITPLEDGKILIIADDDRNATELLKPTKEEVNPRKRDLNESPFFVIQSKKEESNSAA